MMFAQQLFNLIKKLSALMEQEYNLIKKMDLSGAFAICEQKNDLVNLYESCVLEFSQNEKLRQELKDSGLLPQVKEALSEFDQILTKANRRISRIQRSKQAFVEKMHKQLFEHQNPVQCYSRKGQLKGLDCYQKKAPVPTKAVSFSGEL